MTDDEATDPVTAADVGLPVVDGEGNQIGVVSAVEGDAVEVDPDPDVTDDARAALGWSETEGVRRTLPSSDLDRLAGDDAFDSLPKTDLERSGDEQAETAGPVLRVDLGAVNRRG